MSSVSRSRRSISKQRGAEMSSRLIPPNTGAIAWTVRTISSTSFVARQIGQASTPPNSLKRTALPSITGSAPSGPMSPSPSTAVPSLTTATVFCLIVSDQTFVGICRDRGRDACDTGRVGDREIVARLERRSRRHLELAAEVGEERAVGDVLDLDSMHPPYGFEDPLDVRGIGCEERHVAYLVPAPDSHEVDRAEEAARVADRLGERREGAGMVLEAHAHRRAERRRGVHCGLRRG